MLTRARVLGRPSSSKDRMQRTKLEIPFGHAFDKREVSSPKSAVRVRGPSVFDTTVEECAARRHAFACIHRVSPVSETFSRIIHVAAEFI
jgi:hypothetical protein